MEEQAQPLMDTSRDAEAPGSGGPWMLGVGLCLLFLAVIFSVFLMNSGLCLGFGSTCSSPE